MKLSPSSMPESFRVERKSQSYGRYIDLELVRGTDPLVWVGFFKGYSIRLRWAGLEFVVDVVFLGRHYAIFRWPDKDPDFEDLQILVQCGCDYIESIGRE